MLCVRRGAARRCAVVRAVRCGAVRLCCAVLCCAVVRCCAVLCCAVRAGEERRVAIGEKLGDPWAVRARKGAADAKGRAETGVLCRARLARGDPRDLSISVRGGKETKTDSRSSGERKGRSPRRTAGGVPAAQKRAGRSAGEGGSPVAQRAGGVAVLGRGR